MGDLAKCARDKVRPCQLYLLGVLGQRRADLMKAVLIQGNASVRQPLQSSGAGRADAQAWLQPSGRVPTSLLAGVWAEPTKAI
jgi:hypothetical protein